MNLSRLIIIASHIPILLTVALAMLRFKRSDKTLQVFCYYIFLSGIIQFASLGLWFFSKNNMPLLHIYVCLEFLALAWFYTMLLHKFINVKIIWSTAVLFSLFSIANSLFLQPVFTFNSHALTVESVLIIILALFTFIVLLNNTSRQTGGIPNSIGFSWINSGLFIYHSCTLLLFFFGDWITTVLSTSFNLYTWILHSFISMVMYTCFFIGIWKQSKN